MNKKLNVYTVSLDGPDKMGKSTLVKYLARMSNFSLVILDRGPITNIVWNKIQNRDVTYDVDMWKSTLFVKLTADKDDWVIRCRINNEPELPLKFEEHVKAYDEVFADFRQKGCYVIEFNTSKITPFKIANKIIEKLNEINDKGNEI